MNMSYNARKSKMRMIFSTNHVLFFLLLPFFSLFVCSLGMRAGARVRKHYYLNS